MSHILQSSLQKLSHVWERFTHFLYILVTKEKIDPLYEAEVYVEPKMFRSIISVDEHYNGNPVDRIRLHCFANKHRVIRTQFRFLINYLPTIGINKRFQNRLVTMQFKKFVLLLKRSHYHDGSVFFVTSENNPSVEWKIYVKTKFDEPKEIKEWGDKDLPLHNAHSL